MGVLEDGYKSALRYYFNNFRDGWRQDAYLLLAGDFAPDVTAKSPFGKRTNEGTSDRCAFHINRLT